jgi:hypothetical protein
MICAEEGRRRQRRGEKGRLEKHRCPPVSSLERRGGSAANFPLPFGTETLNDKSVNTASKTNAHRRTERVH